MPANKKHHYVPLFYLKRFSIDGKSINLFNWKDGSYVPRAKLKTQCYRDYFYGKEPTVEHALGLTEGAFAKLLAIMDDCLVPPPPTSDDHQLMLLHVLMQYGRTAYAAETSLELVSDLVKYFLGPMAHAERIDLSDIKIGIEEPANFSLSAVVQALPLCLDLEYKLIINKTEEPFVVSDNPAALYNQLLSFRSHGGNVGLASKGLQIFFPVDSFKYIIFYDNAVYQVGQRSSPVVTINNPQDIYELNTLQMCSALENVYFRDNPRNFEALRRKATPFRRVKKSNFRVYPQSSNDLEKRELVMNSTEDLRTNLKLSFVRLRRSAVRWRTHFQKMKVKPAAVVRDQQLCTAHREFMKHVREGTYNASEFFEYLTKQYGFGDERATFEDETNLG